MLRRRQLRALWLTALLASVATVHAQEPELDPIKWSIKASPSGNEKKSFAVELTARIEPGWHLYSTEKIEGGPSPTRITITPGQDFEIAGDVDSPAPHAAYDPNFQVATEFYEHEVAFTIPIRSITQAAPTQKIRVQVRYQTCTPTICLPPKLIELETAVTGEEIKPVQVRTAPEDPAARKSVTTGTQVPDFTFTDFNGKKRGFSEFRGRVVLLDFWASWCSPCLADIPDLKNAYQKYRAQGFEIIGMDSETLGQQKIDLEFAKDAQMKAREIVRTRGILWTQASSDISLPIAEGSFGIQNLPAKILLDRHGRPVAWIKKVSELDELLPALLREQP